MENFIFCAVNFEGRDLKKFKQLEDWSVRQVASKKSLQKQTKSYTAPFNFLSVFIYHRLLSAWRDGRFDWTHKMLLIYFWHGR